MKHGDERENKKHPEDVIPASVGYSQLPGASLSQVFDRPMSAAHVTDFANLNKECLSLERMLERFEGSIGTQKELCDRMKRNLILLEEKFQESNKSSRSISNRPEFSRLNSVRSRGSYSSLPMESTSSNDSVLDNSMVHTKHSDFTTTDLLTNENTSIGLDHQVQETSGPPTSRVCPFCSQDFQNLSFSIYQYHVYDCGRMRPDQAEYHGHALTCPVCDMSFPQLSQEQFTSHVNAHFYD